MTGPQAPGPVHLEPLTAHSFQARQGGHVFVIRETTDGWKTEGHPVHDGLLCPSLEDLVAKIEGRD